MAAGGHHLGRQGSVEVRVPLRCHGRVPGGQVVEPRQDLAAGAVGAVAPPSPGADGRPPAVAQRAPPPGGAVAVGGDLLGREGPILLPVPLLGQLGEEGGQVVLPRHHLLAGAHRAACASAGPGGNGRLPYMALGALPPDLPAAAGHHVLGPQVPILGGVPLGGQVGVLGGQIVVPGADLPAGAVGAARPRRPGLDPGIPHMAVGTLPPHPAVAAPENLVRGEVPVLGGVPLLGQVREPGGQVVKPRSGALAGAVGAAALSPGPGVHCRLPHMALFTAPPEFLAAAVGDGVRGQGAVPAPIPLVQQIPPMETGAVGC